MKNIIYLSISLLLLISCESDTSGISNSGGTGQGGSLARFTIGGDHLYAVNGTKLKVLDIGNPSAIIYRANQELYVDVETVFARDDNTLFIGSTTGMIIYDISNPPQISEISRYGHAMACDPVVADQEYAYVTLRSSVNGNTPCNRGINQLDIVDIRDLGRPQLIQTYPMTHPIGLGIYGDTLLVCDEGIKVMDVSDVLNAYTINIEPAIEAVDIIPYNDLMIIATKTGFAQYRYKNGKLTLLSSL